MSDSQEKKQAKKPVKIIFNVILWVFLAFALITMVFAFMSASNDYGVPTIGNKVVLTVKTDSMSPTMNPGDMIIGTVLTGEEKGNLQENDIITFFADINGKKELNTHRIKSVLEVNGERVYQTQGDNAPGLDPGYVYQHDIVSIWHEGDTKIAGLGAVIGFLQSQLGFLLLIILPLAVFFIYELVRFILLMIQLKNGDRKKISPEEEAIRQRLYEEYLLKQQQTAQEENAADQENKQAETATENDGSEEPKE